MRAFERFSHRFDWPLFTAIVALLAIGMMNLYSASETSGRSLFAAQMVWLVFGVVGAVATTAIDYRHFYRASGFTYAAGIVLLVLVLAVGKNLNGAQRWLYVGIWLQPSEPMKVLAVLALAKLLHDEGASQSERRHYPLLQILVALLPIVLILRQPDLGTAAVVGLILGSMLVAVRLPAGAFVPLIVAGLISLPLCWRFVLTAYQRRRIVTFLNPTRDPSGAGWQARQALLAIGAGGVSGMGFMRGTQNVLNFVPERWTDFPFAVLAEEWGLFGGLLVIGLYTLAVVRALRIAMDARDRFGSVTAVGVGALIFWHAVLNLAMVMGLMPVVGITLPFLSYGGSSLVTMLGASGLLLNVGLRRVTY